MGNPAYVGMFRGYTAADAVRDYRAWVSGDNAFLTFGRPPSMDEIRALRGFDLACWCGLIDQYGNYVPCHVDVLLELAND